MSKKALILTWEKFQDHEVIYPYYRVQEDGFDLGNYYFSTKTTRLLNPFTQNNSPHGNLELKF